MSWLLKDFDLLSVLVRGLVLGLEALVLGGIAFLLLLGKASAGSLRRVAAAVACAFACAQAASTGLSVATLMGGSGLLFTQVRAAPFFVAGAVSVASALLIAVLLGSRLREAPLLCVPCGLGLLTASVAMSHAASRLTGRVPLLLLTAAHHLGVAGWVGAMFFLLLFLRRVSPAPGSLQEINATEAVARRYSRLALASVLLLVGAGVALSCTYVGSWPGLPGTSYGIMIMAKSWLVLTMLLLGAANQRAIAASGRSRFGLQLRRFSEVELGLGFTAVLAAASLTSQAPAVDLQPADRLSPHQIVERMRWQAPRLSSPPLAALAPPNSLQAALVQQQFGAGSVSDENDRAWSEYNHHWAGLIVLSAGLLALLSRGLRGRAPRLHRLTQSWPLLFVGLAVFILLRADPENWPLGPRPFWASFSRPDVLEHRLYALLITAFAFFEWSVERGSLRWGRAAYVFPLVCAAGGAALLTHSHGFGDMHEETFAELSHTPIALLGATAGWGRWLELRLPGSRPARVAAFLWPVCLALVGLFLLDYRES